MDQLPMDVMSLNPSRVSLLFADVSTHHVQDLHVSVFEVFGVWVLVVLALFSQRAHHGLCCILYTLQLENTLV